MQLKGKVAVITGGASGIGLATCLKLAERAVKAVGVVDQAERCATACEEINRTAGREVAIPFSGDVVNADFREAVFRDLEGRHGPVSLCVPAAGITRDDLCVRVNRDNGSTSARIYSEDDFRRVIDVDLIAPIYWALRTVASVATDRAKRGFSRWTPDQSMQGAIVLIGSVSSAGNRGQISYATAKAGLEGAQATLATEAVFYGVRCAIIHPGYTDTPMVRALGEEMIHERILPNTQLRRLIRPDEIASAICFLLENSAVSGTLWADAGWHPNA
jgi:NAD(P)-dependent dehydrogenase (short-subunit alcohol dehydrogenase family)